MELRRYLTIARHRLPLIVLIVVAGFFAAYAITPRQARYSATTSIYVGSQNLDLGQSINAAQTGSGIPAINQYLQTFSYMIRDQRVAAAAATEARVDRSAKKVQAETSAQQILQASLLKVTVTDPDPAVAKALANSMAKVFIDQTRSLSAGKNSQNYLHVWQKATLPTTPIGNGMFRNLILGGLLGLVVAGLLVALLEYLDITIRTADDAERRLGLPVLGVIPALGERLPSTPVLRVRSTGRRDTRGPTSRAERGVSSRG